MFHEHIRFQIISLPETRNKLIKPVRKCFIDVRPVDLFLVLGD